MISGVQNATRTRFVNIKLNWIIINNATQVIRISFYCNWDYHYVCYVPEAILLCIWMEQKKTPSSLNYMYNTSADSCGTLPAVYFRVQYIFRNRAGGVIGGSFLFIRLTFSFLPKTTPFSTYYYNPLETSQSTTGELKSCRKDYTRIHLFIHTNISNELFITFYNNIAVRLHL